ncbi:MAG: restriction endonuclease subunit S, partial [Coriobacteriia bacterium]|nr:restriction endonuclease subunit S [Coriobacteriia bacterium]
MKRYEAYKDSGTSEFGVVPATWNIMSCNHVCGSIFMGKTPIYANEPNAHIIIGQRNNQNGGIEWKNLKFANEDFYGSRPQNEFLRKNDILINSLGTGSVGRIGLCGDLRGNRVLTDGHIIVLRTNRLADARYLFYQLSCQSDLLADEAVGSTNQAFLKVSDIGKRACLQPSLPEQKVIADYLDAKTAEIDALVADCEREVGLLQEYRKAVISEAVTKGLDPDVPMKDSGIEWIGEIPKHWNCENLGGHSWMLTPMRDKPEDLTGPIPWVRIEDYDGKYISASKEELG